ncbi:saccharopine dehydrogenase [Candidatus Pacearchaeota archaeon CG10_big_fil_rev_8_21_14_0_10_32_14]|nr:MAG: saccharopine dehydrogenase [Candidatus Pacearchaeota archaeon CG10_big_fil_rev_8_21_14_0_10_32_14]
MGKVLIIGGGASGRVATHKAAQIPEVFSDITLASRSLEKPYLIQAEVREKRGRDINVEQVDADQTSEVVNLINKTKPEVVIHVALPYQNFPIMDACLETGVHYIDTATPEVREKPGFDYKGQWAYDDKFKEKGLMALLGCGFDPGVTSVYTAYAKKHFLDKIQFLDILDCNAGSHGRTFATNFDPEINIREITLPPRHYDKKKGGWVQTPSIVDRDSIHQTFDFPVTGKKEAYLLYHEELESLVEHYPEIERARFWMTFGENYLSHLRAFIKYGVNSSTPLEFDSNEVSPKEMIKRISETSQRGLFFLNHLMFDKIGLLSEEKIKFSSNRISPVVMLGAVLPKPETLGSGYMGKTVIGNIMWGEFHGEPRSVYIYNVSDHAKCFQEIGCQGISYTAALPSVIGAKMIMTGEWKGSGVFNLEQLDPDHFMRDMDRYGLPWEVEEFSRKFIKDFGD